MKRRDQEYIRRKTGDGAIWEKRKTEAEMDGLCQLRHVSGQQNYEVHGRTGWRRIVSAAATPTIKCEWLE